MSPSTKPVRGVLSKMRFKWSRLSRNAKFTSLAAFALCTYYLTHYIYRFAGGISAYYIEFVYAASGRTYRKDGCWLVIYGRIVSEWRDLDTGDWIFLQRCLGNDDGLLRRGDLPALLSELAWRAVHPKKLPGVLGTLVFALWVLFYLLPWMGARVAEVQAQSVVLLDSILGLLWKIPRYVFSEPGRVFVVAFFFVSFLWHPRMTFYTNLWSITVYIAYNIHNPRNISLASGRDRIRRQLDGLESNLSKINIEKILNVCIIICAPICLRFFKQPIFTWAIIFLGMFLVGKLGALTTPGCRHDSNCTCFLNYILNPRDLGMDGHLHRKHGQLGREKCFHASLNCACFDGHTPATAYGKLEKGLQEANSRASYNLGRFEESEEARNNVQARLADYRRWCQRNHSDLGPLRSGVFCPMAKREANEIVELRKRNEDLAKLLKSQHAKVMINRRPDLGQARNSEMQREVDKMKGNEAALVKRVGTLQAQLEDARRAGQDRLDLQESLKAARLIVKENSTEIEELRLENLQLKNQPGYERSPVRSPCPDSSACKAEKEDLRREIQACKQQIAEQDALVQEAARNLGWKEGNHISLREYLFQSVKALLHYACQEPTKPHALTGGGLSEDRTVAKQAHSDQNLEYVQKLELELERLREDNLNTKRKWPGCSGKLSTFTYLESIPLVFSIYEKLFDKVTQLTNIIISWNNVPPDWEMIRHDDVRHEDFEPVFQCNDILSQKLVESEILRLCNHLVQLTSYMSKQKEHIGSLPPAQQDLIAGAFLETRLVLKEGFEMIHAPLAIEYTNRRLLAGTTAERRHPIFVEMSRMIAQLCSAIKSSVRPEMPLPSWQQHPHPYSSKRYTYDTLVSTLNKYEIHTLHARMKQLVKYMNDMQFPGTENAPDSWKSHENSKIVHDFNSNILARAGQLISFWEQKPTPGSLACRILPDLDIETNITSKRTLDANNMAFISDIPSVEIEPERKTARERRDRIQQLVNLLDDPRSQVELHWTAPQTQGNFLNLPHGTSKLEQLRLENDKFWQWIKDLEGVCASSGILLPKWPKNGGLI